MMNNDSETKQNKKIVKKRKIVFLGIILLAVVSIPLIFRTIYVSSQYIDPQDKYRPIAEDANIVEHELIVKFKKEYSPTYLKDKVQEREELQKTQTGRLQILAQNAEYTAKGLDEPEKRLVDLEEKLRKIGITSYTSLVKSEEEEFETKFILKLNEQIDENEVAKQLSQFTETEYIDPNLIFQVFLKPNDEHYSKQWGYQNIEAEDAWETTTGSNSVRVAVVDTGIDATHPDLPTVQGVSNDPHGHGTHVAGTIAARSNNSTGVSGVNWNISLLGYNALGANGSGSLGDISNKITTAVNNGAKVINLSLGYQRKDPGTGQVIHAPAACPYTAQSDIDNAFSKGVTVVVAAGNDNLSASDSPFANCDKTITVGSIDQNNSKSSFSNFGPDVDIAAPGGNVLSTRSKDCTQSTMCPPTKIVDQNYLYASGTSMAAPHVAGVAALLLSIDSSLSPTRVKECILEGASSGPSSLGGKKLNARGALVACFGDDISQAPDSSPSPEPDITQPPNSNESLSPIDPNGYYIVGASYHDRNDNGIKEDGEESVPNVSVLLTGALDKTTTTDSNGKYLIDSLSAGRFSITYTLGSELSPWRHNVLLSLREKNIKVNLPIPSYMLENYEPPETNPTESPEEDEDTTEGDSGTGLPDIVPSGSPTPTPIQLYNCREVTEERIENNKTIQFSYLECDPAGILEQ